MGANASQPTNHKAVSENSAGSTTTGQINQNSTQNTLPSSTNTKPQISTLSTNNNNIKQEDKTYRAIEQPGNRFDSSFDNSSHSTYDSYLSLKSSNTSSQSFHDSRGSRVSSRSSSDYSSYHKDSKSFQEYLNKKKSFDSSSLQNLKESVIQESQREIISHPTSSVKSSSSEENLFITFESHLSNSFQSDTKNLSNLETNTNLNQEIRDTSENQLLKTEDKTVNSAAAAAAAVQVEETGLDPNKNQVQLLDPILNSLNSSLSHNQNTTYSNKSSEKDLLNQLANLLLTNNTDSQLLNTIQQSQAIYSQELLPSNTTIPKSIITNTLSPEEQALLDQYNQPNSDSNTFVLSPEEQALIDQYNQPNSNNNTSTLSPEEQALLDQYNQPNSNNNTFVLSPEEQALLDQYNQSFDNNTSTLSTEEQALLDQYNQPNSNNNTSTLSPEEQALLDQYSGAINSNFEITPEEQALLDQYNQPNSNNNTSTLSTEEQALLDQYNQPTPNNNTFVLSPEEQALLDQYNQPNSNNNTFILSPEEQALLDQYSGAINSNFEITPEEQALLDQYSGALEEDKKEPSSFSDNYYINQNLKDFDSSIKRSSGESTNSRVDLALNTENNTFKIPESNTEINNLINLLSASMLQNQTDASNLMNSKMSANLHNNKTSSTSTASNSINYGNISNLYGHNINEKDSLSNNNPSTSDSCVRKSENRIKTLMENKVKNNMNMASPKQNIRSSFAEETIILQSINTKLPSGLPRNSIPPDLVPCSSTISENITPNYIYTDNDVMNIQVNSGTEKMKLVRNSFAIEKNNFKKIQISPMELFQDLKGTEDLKIIKIKRGNSLSEELYNRYKKLTIIPEEFPVSNLFLSRLWNAKIEDALKTIEIMEDRQILNTAVLEDNILWCLIDKDHNALLKKVKEKEKIKMHSQLIDSYLKEYGDLALVPDDNYFMQNISLHLIGAYRIEELLQLLKNPIYLETKMRIYSLAAVVTDFRRYLMTDQDPVIKLLLRAVQISSFGNFENLPIFVLKEQMISRLMEMAKQDSDLEEWHIKMKNEYELTKKLQKSRNMPVHLLPLTATLAQAGSIQRLILRGHCEGVKKVLLFPNGLEAATVSTDGLILIWDLDMGDVVLTIDEHEGVNVNCMAINQDGSFLASGDDNGIAIIYDLKEKQQHYRLQGHSKQIKSVLFEKKGGHYLITSSSDMVNCVWNFKTGVCLYKLKDDLGVNNMMLEAWTITRCIDISPDSALLATTDGLFRIRIWNLSNGQLVDTMEGHSETISSVTFAGNSRKFISASHDKTIRIWDLNLLICTHVLCGHKGRINTMKVTPDGLRAVSVSDDSTAIVWDLEKGEKICILDGHCAWINDAAILSNGEVIVTVSGDELVVIWDGETGDVRKVLRGHSGEVNTVALSNKGRFAITGAEDGTARVWDLSIPSSTDDADEEDLNFHHGKILDIIYEEGDNNFITIAKDNIALIWDITDLKPVYILKEHVSGLSWVFRINNTNLCITASGDRCVCVWDMENGKCIRKLEGNTGSRMKAISVTPDGKKGVICLFDSTVSIWNLETMEMENMLIRRGERNESYSHSKAVTGVYITKCGTKVLTVSKDCTARMWDLETLSTILILKGHEDCIIEAILKEEDKLCITSSYDKTVRLWDLNQPEECTMILEHPTMIDHMTVDHKWSRCVTTSDKKAWLWDINEGICLRILDSNNYPILGASFSPNSLYVATYSENSQLQVWNSSRGDLVSVYLADSSIVKCQFGKRDKKEIIIAGDKNGLVHMIEFDI